MMNDWLDDLRGPEAAQQLSEMIHTLCARLDRPVRLMEVCGTHTVAICRHGIRDLLPSSLTLSSGPGCPVCVTSTGELDTCIETARLPGVTVATFGDLIRVPGSRTTLQQEQGRGAEVRIVYSPLDALDLARRESQRQVVFLGVGFETTAPTVAATILSAAAEKIDNFSVICAHKLVPPVLHALLADPEVKLDGLILPGHVSVMLGAGAYRVFSQRYHVPCVIAGFEPADILEAVARLTMQLVEGRAEVEVGYRRAVDEEGNPKAMALMQQVFEPVDATWRGLGVIAGSGLAIREEFAHYDARRRFNLVTREAPDPPGCACGRVLKSLIPPSGCPLFGRACTPQHPVGPCMVSGEGACGAHYRFRAVG
ncbi:MAG: hydrogenase formation protein HypD [Desulfobulbaceae bacterium A2]|nr:MAG: hydrogenase formation protein HypD [Desulfobulbaceae bacterium A2]